jgi:predicted branched-subunit amino acid permease
MSISTVKSPFREGLFKGLPFTLVGVPFAVLFGLVATEAGMSVAQVLSFSAVVFAGASQLTALQMMNEAAPVLVVIAAAMAVNMRMAMYSASLQPHLGAAPLWQRALIAYINVDVSYAISIQKFEDTPQMRLSDKVAYFVGTIIVMAPLWVLGSYIGAKAGDALPETIALDFAMPILFLALVAPMVKTLAHLGAAVTSIIAAMVFSFLPSGIGILFAAFLAMAVGAEIERRRAQ